MAGPTKPIHMDAFPGMNNVVKDAPIRAILNMDVASEGTEKKPGGPLVKRAGYSLWQALAGAHSLFCDGSQFFCVRTGTTTMERLCRIAPDKTITHVCDIAGSGDPLFYLQIDGRLFISSRNWNGICEDGVVRDWGTEFSDDPADYDTAASSEELMLMGTIKAPLMENLALAGGRIFGSVGKRVYYNDPPLAYEMFRADTFHEFTDEIVMIAVSNAGMYFASAATTWFTPGFDPHEFVPVVVGDGAIPGTLQYLDDFRQMNNVPVWLDSDGIQAGMQGTVIPVNKNSVRIDHGGMRAASHLTADGRFVSSMPTPDVAYAGDSVTCSIIRNGVLIT